MKRWARVPKLPFRRTVDGVIVLTFDGEAVVLQSATALLWLELSEPRTTSELATRLGTVVDEDDGSLMSSLQTALAQLQSLHLVHPS